MKALAAATFLTCALAVLLAVFAPRASRTVVVSARTPGYVARILVREGDDVAAGEVVAEVDSSEAALARAEAAASLEEARAHGIESDARLAIARARVDEAKAALAAEEASGESAAAELGRCEELRRASEGAVSTQALDAARAAARSAKARALGARAKLVATGAQVRLAESELLAARAAVTVAAARLARADLALAGTRLVALEHGRIERIAATPGALVAAGQPVVELRAAPTSE